MTSARRFCIFGLVLWLLVGALPGFPPGFADEAPPPSPRLGSSDNTPRLFAFAQALLEEGEYYRAIGEFQRFLFFYAEHPLAPQAQLRIGMAFFCGERWLQAFEVFRRVAQAAPDTPIGQAAALWMAETRAQGGDHSQAIRLYQEVITQYPGTFAAQRAAYLIGWSLLRKHQWTEAHSAMA
ncbi:MAG: tetratricopeptide repeat protein, partial [Nitrospinae bacterium]|nr:tetratricopeptide repeat protein [Nitrospinota bacterium]